MTDWGQPIDIPAPRVVGYLAYEVGQYLENTTAMHAHLEGDEVALAQYDACLTFDMESGKRWLTAISQEALDRLVKQCRKPSMWSEQTDVFGRIQANTTQQEYEHKVTRVREWIAQGDVYQVNISHQFNAPISSEADSSALYAHLRERYPAPYGAYFDTGAMQILSNSPECFLRVNLNATSRTVATWPLKGTRPRTDSAIELQNNPKDRAEHVMIVDLERNDLGRVAQTGSVHVENLLGIVSYATVHHLESRIEATLRPDVDLIDVLQATFPGGSITGAPKIRAMQIISDMEEETRGVYCGALGAIAYGGDVSVWNIPIRTGVVAGGQLQFRVGGGVVMDSDPMAEYEETITKAQAFLNTINAPVD